MTTRRRTSRWLRTAMTGAIACTLLVTGCSGRDAEGGPRAGHSATPEASRPDAASRTTEATPPPATASTGTGATSAAPTPGDGGTADRTPRLPTVDTDGVPTALAALARNLYAGREVPATDPVRRVLREAPPPDDTVRVRAGTGTWKGTPIAVLTAGDDVTLVVQRDGRWQVVGGWWPSLGRAEPMLGGPRHVLMIGSDARPGEPVDGMRADTLQVVGVDGQGGGGVMGIARDAWVPMPSGGRAKINNAMVLGGPQAQQDTVAVVTGLPLEGYVLTGFESFTALVDDLGGVTVDAPVPVLDVPAGRHELDGETALRYSRERKTLPDGDFGRSRHQGVVLFGLALRTRAESPVGLPEVLSTASTHVQTNLSAEQALTLGATIYVVDVSRVGHEVAKGTLGWSADGQSIVRLDDEAHTDFDDFSDGNLD